MIILGDFTRTFMRHLSVYIWLIIIWEGNGHCERHAVNEIELCCKTK